MSINYFAQATNFESAMSALSASILASDGRDWSRVTAPRPICQQIGRGFLLLQHRLDDRSGLTCLHRLRLVTLRAQDGQPSRLQHSYAFLLDVQGGV
mgnify:CR=1 FL=1